jgi:hypothetical protein
MRGTWHVLLSDGAVTSTIFYKSGRWDFVVPPRASADPCRLQAILTKLNGNSCGGAAVSILSVSRKLIKFVGVGKRTQDLEAT